ncbi:hypothetical protein DMA11_11685 [Marinilabiliaceae bacterium JC017]|nr:hypothetical protein DMA11_11685 [Marinilabiliaceae bacterium JC017]
MSKTKKRRKKGVSTQERKQQLAAQKKYFIARLFDFGRKLGITDVLKLIPAREYNTLFGYHLKQFKVKTAPGTQIPSMVLKKMEALVHFSVNNFPLLQEEYADFTLIEYLEYGHILWRYQETLELDWYPRASQVKEGLMPVVEMVEKNGDPTTYLLGVVDVIARQYCKANSRYYWMDVVVKRSDVENNGTSINFIVHRVFCQKRVFKIEEGARPAFRIGVPNAYEKGMRWLTARLIGHDKETGETVEPFDADIYLQSHALLRLYERLDGLEKCVVHSNMLGSLSKFKVVEYQEQSMVEYYFDNVKLGYLVLDFSSGQVLVRTFLFLTHRKTPEGDKLARLGRLSYADIPFWKMDKLSTFTKSDIGNHARLRQLFDDAGCGHLFDFDAEKWGQKGDAIAKGKALAGYLTLAENN